MKYKGISTASLVLGIISFLVSVTALFLGGHIGIQLAISGICIVLSVLALIFGYIGKDENWTAKAGLVLGIISTIFFSVCIIEGVIRL